jgi:hypothetical protein
MCAVTRIAFALAVSLATPSPLLTIVAGHFHDFFSMLWFLDTNDNRTLLHSPRQPFMPSQELPRHSSWASPLDRRQARQVASRRASS